MARVAGSPRLTWINSSDGLRSKSPKVRTLIRKQAMSKAAAARRRSRYSATSKKQDSFQYQAYQHTYEAAEQGFEDSPFPDDYIQPLYPETESLHSNQSMLPVFKASESVIGDSHQLSYMPTPEWIPASPSSTGFEAMRIAFDFDPITLSGLTDLHVGRATARPLRDKPGWLREILRCKKWSYYEYLPSRFGQTRCLDDAIWCIAARVRQWFDNPADPSRLALELYSKAVGSLQAALDDPVLCHHPNVLCATEVMTIFELLDSGRDMLSNPYTKGAATLIEFRGPQGYQSDFEKSLLLAQWGPIYTEAIQNSTPCFLEEPAWQATVQSIMLERSNYIPYADAYMAIWACLSEIPSLFRSVKSVVCSTHETPHTVRETLLSRAYDLRCLVMDVGAKHSLMFTKVYGIETYSFVLRDEAEGTERYEILGALATLLMKIERHIVALNPSLAVTMEKHAQQLAIQILDLARVTSELHPRATLYLAFGALAARVVLLTASEWRRETLFRIPNRVIAKPVFERWVGLHSSQNVSHDEEWRDKYGETQFPFRQDLEVP
ncbi:MAG: hypothetical protein L6R38_006739 [Xanthoria sp. 2 TBL-2021]|nr:MAG: hypothetical protein L6R38_006739 [Xanthoria sp. 2 TBL-2021]